VCYDDDVNTSVLYRFKFIWDLEFFKGFKFERCEFNAL